MGFSQDFHLPHPLAEITALHLLKSNYEVPNTEEHAGRLFFKNHSKVLEIGMKLTKDKVKVNFSTDGLIARHQTHPPKCLKNQASGQASGKLSPNENASAQS